MEPIQNASQDLPSYHPTLLSAIQRRVEQPEVSSFAWLDLGCGRGQVLLNLDRCLSPEARQKIAFTGVDLDHKHCLETERLAGQYCGKTRIFPAQSHRFERLLEPGELFDVITLTNTVREVSPAELAQTFCAALCRLKPHGFLYLYDVESLPQPEEGAIAWLGEEVASVFGAMLRAVGETACELRPFLVAQRTSHGWGLCLHRERLSLSAAQLADRRKAMARAAEDMLLTCLERQFLFAQEVASDLEDYGRHGNGEAGQVEAVLGGLRSRGQIFGLGTPGQACQIKELVLWVMVAWELVGFMWVFLAMSQRRECGSNNGSEC